MFSRPALKPPLKEKTNIPHRTTPPSQKAYFSEHGALPIIEA
jgi:hypothetical protein